MNVTPLPKIKPYRSREGLGRYRELHTVCEIPGCGRAAAKTPHHLKTRGAGGGDEWGNLMSLCPICHTRAHTEAEFARKVKELKHA